ncbi:helix-turn-helix domain-containing protein [Crystallibacter degradans]|uniref:helix-turn-helix domain-containing protein n=1 Tax=Crystallibacter degradans TaxID=2726743 RepID=UPI001474BD2A|nr:helix-turn-helix domain-containing protein [Arthrobacter sp. SF27]NMR28663.1 helix-turn-helix domain-containing protein [Arthrobacter sp. SF27]
MANRSSADLVLHPVRLRICQTLLGGRSLTTAGMAAQLPDVPPATLYRHIRTLAEAGVLAVVEERQVRGTTERTYALDLAATELSADALASMSPEDHRKAFMGFAAGLLALFDRYIDGALDRGKVDLVRDGVGYRQTALWLTDAEFEEFAGEMRDVVQKYSANTPGKGRKRRALSTIVIPSDSPVED